MNSDLKFERNQLMAFSWLLLLTPALRLFPSEASRLAGRGAWLSALVSALPLALYVFFLTRFMDHRQEDEGMGELIVRSLGGRGGRAVMPLFGLWFGLYAGFVLRSGAERFLTTVYSNSTPEFFSVVLGTAALIAALGSPRSMARVAKMVLPVVLGVMLLVLISALSSVDASNFLPLSAADAVPVVLGVVPGVNIIAAVLYIVCFIEGDTRRRPGRFRAFMIWVVLACLMLAMIIFELFGAFGPELTSQLTRPFFSLVRNMVFFKAVERIEALVVSLWVFPDFLMVSLLIYLSQFCLRLGWCKSARYRGEKLTDVSGGRWIIWLCGTAAVICAIFIGPDSASLSLWSDRVIPIVNMSFAFLVLPAVFAVGKISKRL